MAERPRVFGVPPNAIDDEAVNAIRTKILQVCEPRGYASIGSLAARVRALVPGPGWAGYETFSEWLSVTLPDVTLTRHPFAEGTVWRDVETSAQPVQSRGLPAELEEEVRAAVAASFAGRTHQPLSTIANIITHGFPAIHVTGKFIRWFARHFPEYNITDQPYTEGTVWLVGDPAAALKKTSTDPSESEEVRVAVLRVLGPRSHISGAGLRLGLLQELPHLQIEGKFMQWIARVCPNFPTSTSPFAEGTVWRDQQSLDEAAAGASDSVPPRLNHETRSEVRRVVAEILADPPYLAGGTLGVRLRERLPDLQETWRSMSTALADICPELATTSFPFVPVTFWRSDYDMRRTLLRASNGLSETDASAAIAAATDVDEFDEALRIYVRVGVELAGGLTTNHFYSKFALRSRLPNSDDDLSAPDWLGVNAPELVMSRQRVTLRMLRPPSAAGEVTTSISAPVLAVAVQIAEELARSSPAPVPLLDVRNALEAAGIAMRRTDDTSSFGEILSAIESTSEVKVVRGSGGLLWVPGLHPDIG